MNTDVIIVGAELDAFIASIRLQELGYTSRVLANGQGSYLYSSGNIKVLDFKENNNSDNNNEIETINLYCAEDELKDYSSMRDFNVEARKKKEIITVKTVSLEDLLKEHKAPKKIDYLSIDTEGSEYTILKNFNFKLYEISIITIEHNYIDDQRNNIKSLLEKNNFVRVFEKISRMDDWYINENNSVLKKLKLK